MIEHGWCFCEAIKAQRLVSLFGFASTMNWVCFDHDDDCSRSIGSPLAIWIGYRPVQVRFVRGHPKRFSKTKGVTRSFCGDCGTSIAYSDDGLPDEFSLSIGFMGSLERFPPRAQAYWEMRQPFVAEKLPRIDGLPSENRARGNPKAR